jgi:hypothetical protein
MKKHDALDEDSSWADSRGCPDALAARLYPESPYLQSEWLRAIEVVRGSRRGWLLESPLARLAPEFRVKTQH